MCESGFVFCFAQTPFGKFTELARLLGHEKKYFSASGASDGFAEFIHKMAVVLARDQAEPNTFEDLFGGFSARYCYIDGKYYISVRDLIIGMCVENPKETKDVWEKACCYASKTWNRIIECKKIRNIDDFLKTFQFEGKRFL